jgi:hypothetical protein
MTHYERCVAALEGEPVDRAPLLGGFICQEDFYVQGGPAESVEHFWTSPREFAIEAFLRVGADVIVQFVLPKRSEESTGDKDTGPTNFGKGHSHDQFPDPDSVVEFVRNWPGIEQVHRDFIGQKAYYDYLKIMNTGSREMAPMVWIPGHVCGCPSFMWYSKFGYENYFEAMITEPEVFDRFFASLGEERRLLNAEVARATSDHGLLPVVYCGEDICYSDGPLCSPKLLRDIYFPHLKKALQPLKDSGMKVVWHSDGDIMPIIHDLIDCGVDGFQGLEEDHGMDLAVLAEMTNTKGDPLILWGSISVTSTLPFGTVEDVRADVDRCLRIGKDNGRLFLSPSSSVGPEVPTDNILELYRHGIESGFDVQRSA